MRIQQSRIRFPENYLNGISQDSDFYVGLTDLSALTSKLNVLGFSSVNVGEQVLPTAIGKVSNFNANGGILKRKDLPKETAYREAEIKDWHGHYHTVDIPYLRYPREHIEAPNVELLIRTGANNNSVLVSPVLNNNSSKISLIKHTINLFLELFGECEILQDDLLPSFNVPVTRLNWDVLPQGSYPWSSVQGRVQNVINSVNLQRRNIIEYRIKKISSYTPDIVAVGKAGFKGYIIMGFSQKNVFVLESIYTGNATYILGQNWSAISQMTKEQILNQNLHQARFVHAQGWENQIDRLLK